MNKDDALEVTSLKAYYLMNFFGITREVRAVDDITMSVRRNEIYGIAGESSSGKTTFIKVLAAAMRPPLQIVSGKVEYRIGGRTISPQSMRDDELAELHWKHLSYIMQGSMSVLNPVRRIQQQKLEEVIGENTDRARVRRAESWRSARSVRNIRLNVMALEDLFNGSQGMSVQLGNVLYADDVETVNTAFADLNASLAPLPDSLEAALAEEGGHANMLAVASRLDALYEALEAALKNTDLYLGFNSLDGD